VKREGFHRHLYLLILTAIWAALLVIAQVAMGFIPNGELVSLLITIFTLKYKKHALAAIYIFVLIEGVIYGFGYWWFNYLYVWTILWLMIVILPKIDSAIYYAVILGVFGLMFGAFCSLIYFFIGGPSMALAYFLAGIRFDFYHLIGNVVITLILYRPLTLVMKHAK